MSIIEKIRKQPPHMRSKFALLSAVFVTVLIAGAWSTTLPARFNAITQVVADSEEDEKNPFSGILDSARTQLGSVVDSVQGPEEFDDVYIPDQSATGTVTGITATTSPDLIERDGYARESDEFSFPTTTAGDAPVSMSSSTSDTSTPKATTKPPAIILIATTTTSSTTKTTPETE